MGVRLIPNQHRLIGIGVMHIEQRLTLLGQIERRFSGVHTAPCDDRSRVQ